MFYWEDDLRLSAANGRLIEIFISIDKMTTTLKSSGNDRLIQFRVASIAVEPPRLPVLLCMRY
jgi:hypothetical protein